MTLYEFENKDKQADIAIKLFNDSYLGKECFTDNKRNKKGIVLGLNKHFSFGLYDPISPGYKNKAYVGFNIVQRATAIVYTVGLKLEDSHIPKLVSFGLFMNANSAPQEYIEIPAKSRKVYTERLHKV